MKRTVVFGYGPVGRETVALLAGRGDDVIVAQRHRPENLPAGVRFEACDITNGAATAALCADREIVICAAGFPYSAAVWEQAWPAAMSALLNACERFGARLVFADNLYMAGPQTAPLREDMPLTDYGRKPRVRARITRMWQEAHAAARASVCAVRASDFYGPDTPTSVVSAYGVAPLLAGKSALIPYNCDFPHDYAYVPDYARAIVTLVDAPDDAYGQAWNVPNAPTRTLRNLLALAAEIAGVPLRVRVVPSWAQPILGLVAPPVYELVEMRFQTDRPYLVDASKFIARFGWSATPFEQGLAETVAFYRAAQASSGA